MYLLFVSDIAIFVLKRDVKLQLTNCVSVVEGYECERNHTLFGAQGQIRSSMYPVPTVAAMCEWWSINAPGQITVR